MTEKIAPRFRKTKTDKWAVMAPVEDLEKALASGGTIDVQRRSGDWSTFTVASLGKAFDVDGVSMCYGYGPEEETADSGESIPQSAPADRSGRSSRRSAPPAGSSPRQSRPANTDPPPRDPTEPLPEFRGGPDDEWDNSPF